MSGDDFKAIEDIEALIRVGAQSVISGKSAIEKELEAERAARAAADRLYNSEKSARAKADRLYADERAAKVAADARAQTAEREASGLQGRLDAADRTAAEAARNVAAAQQLVSQVQSEKNKVAGELATVKPLYEAARAQVQTYETVTLPAKETKIGELEAKVAAVKSEKAEVAGKLDDKKAEVAQKDARIIELQKEEGYKARYDALMTRLETLKANVVGYFQEAKK